MVQFVSTCWFRQMPKFTWWSISKLFRSTPLRSYQVTRPQKILFFHNRASCFSRTFLEPRILISQNAVTMFSVSMSYGLHASQLINVSGKRLSSPLVFPPNWPLLTPFLLRFQTHPQCSAGSYVTCMIGRVFTAVTCHPPSPLHAILK